MTKPQPRTSPLPRVEATSVDGQPAWIKRREVLGLRLRLQKGNPERAFHAELAALRRMANRGLPVPRVLQADAQAFVITDGGPNLRRLIQKGHLSDPDRDVALIAAAQALAHLHAAGFSHGRPSLKDICLQDGVITLIDFERAHPSRDTPNGHAADVIIFFHSMIGVMGALTPAVRAAKDAYIADAPPGIWDIAVARVRKLAVFARLGNPILKRLSHKPEFASIVPTIALFAQHPDTDAGGTQG